MKSVRLFIAAVAFAATASPAMAQFNSDARSGIARVNLVSANPVGLLFEWYNGEFEHAITPTISLAVAASSYDFDERYSSVDGIVRYYPSAKALRGFSVGASAGYLDVDDDEGCPGCTSSSGSSATLGIRADYVWILGRDQHFAAAAGVGAKRLLSDVYDVEGVPIGRLSIGWAW